MHEHVGTGRSLDDEPNTVAVSPVRTSLRPARGGAEDVRRGHDACRSRASRSRRAGARRARGRSARRVESATSTSKRPGRACSTSAVAERRHAVLDGERFDPVAVALEPFAGLELDSCDLVASGARRSGRACAGDRRALSARTSSAASRGPRSANVFSMPGKAEVVVGVVVREKDLLELDEADVAAQELTLRALRAVEQEPLTAAPNERRAAVRAWPSAWSPTSRGRRRRGPRRPIVLGRSKSALCEPIQRRMRRMRAYRSSGLGALPDAAADVPRSRPRSSSWSGPSYSRRGSRAISATAALADNARDVAAYTDAVLAPTVVRGNGRRDAARAATPRSHGSFPERRARASTSTPETGDSSFSTTRPERIGTTALEPRPQDTSSAPASRAPTSSIRWERQPPVVKVWAPLHTRTRTRRRRRRGLARRGRRHRHDRRLDADDLVRGRDRLRSPLARARAPRSRRVRADADPERGPRRSARTTSSSPRASSRPRSSRRSRR